MGAPEVEGVTVETVTPEVAARYLGRNMHNRPLRPRIVDAYARDMRNGDWRWTGEAIKFDTTGALLDGQHRLTAVLEADRPVPFLVVRGLPAETQDVMDTGVRRKFSDVLALRKEPYPDTLATVVRAVTVWEGTGGFTTPRGTLTNAEMFRTLEKYPWLREGLPTINQVARGAGLPPSLAGLCWWLFIQLDGDDAMHFFNRLASGEDHHEGEPIYMLRKLLMAAPRTTLANSRTRRYLAAVTIKAWNKYRDGESCAVLRFAAGGANPETFPMPH